MTAFVILILKILKTVLSICFVLGTIALVHEFGHYITAKLTGIWVIEFAIGFGNRLLKRKCNEQSDMEKRLQLAETEISCFKEFDYAVVNNNINEAIAQIVSIIRAEECNIKRF